MKEVYGDMFNYLGRMKFRLCITTNGFLKNDGTAVMGRGNAAQAVRVWRDEYNIDLPKLLGKAIHQRGNEIIHLTPQLYTFPVKENWYDKASRRLIKRSMEQLRKIAAKMPDKIFILPRPGCGNGQLKWEKVKPLLEPVPNNVWIIATWKENEKYADTYRVPNQKAQ